MIKALFSLFRRPEKPKKERGPRFYENPPFTQEDLDEAAKIIHRLIIVEDCRDGTYNMACAFRAGRDFEIAKREASSGH